MTSVSRQLWKTYTELRRHFGYAPQWWPGSPLEIALTAILVQQCDWSAAWKGVRRLGERRLLSLPALAETNPLELQPLIREVAFVPTKSRRLVHFARAILAKDHQSIETYLSTATATAALRADLLALDGIGEETADCILLFASEHASFVIDAYTRRVMTRLDLFAERRNLWSGSYGELKDFFERHILSDLSLYKDFALAPDVPREVALFRDFHAQFVELGKHHCLKTRPRCHLGGQKGWIDYEICRPHCRETECAACPLAKSCVMSDSLFLKPLPFEHRGEE